MGTRVLAMTQSKFLDVLRAQLGMTVGESSEDGVPMDAQVPSVRVTWQGLVEIKLVSSAYDGPDEGARVPWLKGEFLR